MRGEGHAEHSNGSPLRMHSGGFPFRSCHRMRPTCGPESARRRHYVYHASQDERERIKQAHLLLAAANAMQPGVFSLSSWDLVGALPISERSVADRVADGDWRWINRGGVDLMGANRKSTASAFGIERAKSLYGSLPEQLSDRRSFVSQLREILAARRNYRLCEGELVAVPDLKNKACCVLLMRVPGAYLGAVTALNFSKQQLDEQVSLVPLLKRDAQNPTAGSAINILTEDRLPLSKEGSLAIQIPGHSFRTFVIERANAW